MHMLKIASIINWILGRLLSWYTLPCFCSTLPCYLNKVLRLAILTKLRIDFLKSLLKILANYFLNREGGKGGV